MEVTVLLISEFCAEVGRISFQLICTHRPPPLNAACLHLEQTNHLLYS